MQIKCPKCSATYEVPEAALPKEQRGDKPRKMRCFKCKTVFAVSMRPAKPAEEPVEKPVEEKRVGTSKPDSRSTPEPEKLTPPLAHLVEPEQASEPPEPEITAEEEELCISVFDYGDTQSNTSDNAQPEPAAPPRVVSRTSAWNVETTLDLSGYATKGQMPIRRFIMFGFGVVLALIILMFVFIAARNDWVISFPDLPEQIGIAFWGEEARKPPKAVQELEVTITEGYQALAKNKQPVLVVTGEVRNPNDEARANVVLQGRIVSTDGSVRFETTAPCGKAFKKSKLKKTKRGSFNRLYIRKGKLYDCKVKANSKRKYQLIFDNMPPDYKEKYRVEVKVISGNVKEEEKQD